MDVLTGPCWTIYIGDVRDGLARLQPGSVHAAVTSPPYWRLRDYGVAGQLGMEATPPVVLDPFAGVCSTGVAALRLGCRFVGCELNPEYAHAGHERLLAEWARLQANAQRDRRPQQTLLFEESEE